MASSVEGPSTNLNLTMEVIELFGVDPFEIRSSMRRDSLEGSK